MRCGVVWGVVWSLGLGACVHGPGTGAPELYALDSLRLRCLQSPLLCMGAGGEVGSGPVQTVGVAVASVKAALEVLDNATRLSIKSALEECANEARTEVLLKHRGAFQGPLPTAEDCRGMTVDEKGRSVTWAIRLGVEMHEVALRCAREKLEKRRPGGFSLQPRYRFDPETKKKSVISPEEKEALLRRGGEELKGTLEPDVVLHAGDPLQVQAVFDFKFRCVNFDEPPRWREYPEGHRHFGKTQGQVYEEAFGEYVDLIGPRRGVFW